MDDLDNFRFIQVDFVAEGGFLLIIHTGFRKFRWISWISIFRPTDGELSSTKHVGLHFGPSLAPAPAGSGRFQRTMRSLISCVHHVLVSSSLCDVSRLGNCCTVTLLVTVSYGE